MDEDEIYEESSKAFASNQPAYEGTVEAILFEAIEQAASYTHNVTAEEADVIQAEALAAIRTAVERADVGRKEKDPTGYANEVNLRAWQDGWNACHKEYKANLERELFG